MSFEKADKIPYFHIRLMRFLATRAILSLLLAAFWASIAYPQPAATDELESQLGLVDLPAYRAALSGKATADGARASGPPRFVSFRELWDQPETWRGRRVQVEGRVVRVFRQGAVGSFPPLVEAWLATPAGDLLCVEFPQDESPNHKDESFEPSRPVIFTGTFLKTIRYAAGDQPRLAPLIVGDRPPATSKNVSGLKRDAPPSPRAVGESPGAGRHEDGSLDPWSPSARGLALALALSAVGVLAWQHLRVRMPARRSGLDRAMGDPPLEFVKMEPVNGPVHPDA